MKWTDSDVQNSGKKEESMADTLVELNVGHIPEHICERRGPQQSQWRRLLCHSFIRHQSGSDAFFRNLEGVEKRQFCQFELLALWSSKNGWSDENNGAHVWNKTKAKCKRIRQQRYSVLHGRYISIMSRILISQDFLCNWKRTPAEPTFGAYTASPTPPTTTISMTSNRNKQCLREDG